MDSRRAALGCLLACALAGRAVSGGDESSKRPLAKPLYSHGNEEAIARDFFQDRRGGVFLDVGAAAPIDKSNTFYLERHLGWSGIAVDALPEFARAWKAKRPRSKFFNFLVSDHADTVEPFYRSELKGTSAARKQGEAMTGPAGNKVKFDELKVPTTTLDKLLDSSGVAAIDFFSIDIEGYEPVALAGFEIERFRPALVCIEAKPANHEKILAYFAAHGYERLDRYLAYDRTNWYFAPKPR